MPVHGADRLYIGDQLIVGGQCEPDTYYINLQNTSATAIAQQGWILETSSDCTVSYTNDGVLATPAGQTLNISKYIDDLSIYSGVTITINAYIYMGGWYGGVCPYLSSTTSNDDGYFANRITYNSGNYKGLWIYKNNAQPAKDYTASSSGRDEVSIDFDFTTGLITAKDNVSTITWTEPTISDILSKHYLGGHAGGANNVIHTLKDIKIQFR